MEKLLKLAACYREMAAACINQALLDPAVASASASERDELIAKLRRMTVENGCTEAEADTAAQMVLRLEMPA